MFWGLAAITAAELNYPDVPGQYSWLSLAQGVFNTQIRRWDTTTCDGGLRWQLWVYQAGYTLKNSVSNGGLFQLSARLARYTNNQTYADWAQKIWDWCEGSQLLNNHTWNVADSTTVENNCKTQGNDQWSYNYGLFLGGAALALGAAVDSTRACSGLFPSADPSDLKSMTCAAAVPDKV